MYRARQYTCLCGVNLRVQIRPQGGSTWNSGPSIVTTTSTAASAAACASCSRRPSYHQRAPSPRRRGRNSWQPRLGSAGAASLGRVRAGASRSCHEFTSRPLATSPDFDPTNFDSANFPPERSRHAWSSCICSSARARSAAVHSDRNPESLYCSLHEFWRWTLLRIIIIFQAQGDWQGSRWQAPERGGLRLPRQAEAGGTSHRHPVSGPRGCCALQLHFPRCSLGALRIGAAMASGEVASA